MPVKAMLECDASLSLISCRSFYASSVLANCLQEWHSAWFSAMRLASYRSLKSALPPSDTLEATSLLTFKILTMPASMSDGPEHRHRLSRDEPPSVKVSTASRRASPKTPGFCESSLIPEDHLCIGTQHGWRRWPFQRLQYVQEAQDCCKRLSAESAQPLTDAVWASTTPVCPMYQVKPPMYGLSTTACIHSQSRSP